MTTVIFFEILMLTCTIVVDLNTREVLSAVVGDSTTSSVCTELLQSAVRGSHFERCLEVDKFALDFWEVDKFALDILGTADSA